MLDFLWPHSKEKKRAEVLYRTAVEQARSEAFYLDLGVPDTIDGRFDLISLHVILIMLRLQEDDVQSTTFNQKLFDVMFKDMERALREMGIGDLSVPKHMTRMMNGFNGRRQHYAEALSEQESLEDVLRRNIYGTADSPHLEAVQKLSDYVRQCRTYLSGQSAKEILDGTVFYPDIQK